MLTPDLEGDGMTDDSPALQEALDLCRATPPTLHLPPRWVVAEGPDAG